MRQTLPRSKVREVWQTACAQLEIELSQGAFSTWILSSPLTNLTIQNNKIIATITSPSGFLATNLKKGFGFHIQKVLSSILDQKVEVEFRVGDPVSASSGAENEARVGGEAGANTNINTSANSKNANFNQLNTRRLASTPPLTHSPTSTYPTPPTNSPSPKVEDLFSKAVIESSSKNQTEVRAKNVGLRQDYTFETFAVSSSNEMAHAAATAVSKNPGEAYNPLFLYGGVGVGKTHLMQAIGHNILQHHPFFKIIYCTGEDFTNQIVGAIKNKTAISFKERFRTVDVLLIDDVQFIAGKNTVQEEFFHTFNALTKNNKQVVLTSDRPPHEITLLEGRLRSRFEAGLMIDIQQPSFELRTAILLIKAKALNLPLNIEVAKNIASRVDSARKIEGILNSLRSEVEFKGNALSPELIEKVLASEADNKRPLLKASIQDVIKTVANHFHLKQAIIKGKSRKKKITYARHVAMYVCKEDLDEPYAEIGRWFSNRDHTTVLHAYNKITDLIQQNENLKQEVSAIRMSLSGLR
jgi:chromosomal replication initiator protein